MEPITLYTNFKKIDYLSVYSSNFHSLTLRDKKSRILRTGDVNSFSLGGSLSREWAARWCWWKIGPIVLLQSPHVTAPQRITLGACLQHEGA